MTEHIQPLVIISGGNGYVGQAIAEELNTRGWKIVILSRSKKDDCHFDSYQCDITNEEEVAHAVAAIVASFGKVEACVHAAANPLERKKLLSITPSSFSATIDTALRGCFLLAKTVTPHMNTDSSFIGITTEALDAPSTQSMGAYQVAKYGLRGLLRFLSTELSAKGIRVNAVAPGFLGGGLNSDLPQHVIEFIQKKTPSPQSSTDVALLVADICENLPQYPSGTSITVNPRTVSRL